MVESVFISSIRGFVESMCLFFCSVFSSSAVSGRFVEISESSLHHRFLGALGNKCIQSSLVVYLSVSWKSVYLVSIKGISIDLSVWWKSVCLVFIGAYLGIKEISGSSYSLHHPCRGVRLVEIMQCVLPSSVISGCVMEIDVSSLHQRYQVVHRNQ